MNKRELTESEYLNLLEEVFQKLYHAQLELVSAQKGIQAVIQLLKEFSQKPVISEPQDPVYQEVEKILRQLLDMLTTCVNSLSDVIPPASWQDFHFVFLRSLELQREGYEEMLLAFKDGDSRHVFAGNQKVKLGLKLLEAGKKVEISDIDGSDRYKGGTELEQ